MSADFFEIALEHHRTGRLREAEAGYRRLIEESPDHANAHHWLGVLLLQAGQATSAVTLLEKAVELSPQDAAFSFNLGQAYLKASRPTDAVVAFSSSLVADPARAETWFGLGTAFLGRQQPGDAIRAVDALREAQTNGMDSVDLHRQLATALLAANRIDQAIERCQLVITRQPNDSMAYYCLAASYQRKGDGKGVRKNLLKSLEIDPAFAQGWYGLGMLESEEGKLAQAAALLRRAMKARPDYVAARQALVQVLQRMGHHHEAAEVPPASQPAVKPETTIEDLERKITPDRSSLELHYALAALTNVIPPSTVPSAAVSGLFDKYADTFDEHLVGTLHYRAPQLIADALSQETLGDVLDLGCGTGLCGPLLRPRTKTLTGVDLSAGMIDKARSRDCYDRLEVSDLVSYLRAHPREFDLLVAADVLLYLGDLLPTFEAATASVRTGGRFAFTLEAGGGDRYDLTLKTRRYRHSKPYIQKLAGMFGWSEEKLDLVALRSEAMKPVAGWLVVLRIP